MASESKRTLAQKIAGLSGPGKALLLVSAMAIVVVLVAAIVVAGQAGDGVAPVMMEGAGSNSTSSTATSATSSSASGTAAVVGAPAASGSASGGAGSSPHGSSSKSSGSTSSSSAGGSKGSGPGSSGTASESDSNSSPKTPPVLTAELRSRIAKELVAAEKRAEAEAAAKFPIDPAKGGSASNNAAYHDLRSRLIDEYNAIIAEKYGLTTDQMIELMIIDAASAE